MAPDDLWHHIDDLEWSTKDLRHLAAQNEAQQSSVASR